MNKYYLTPIILIKQVHLRIFFILKKKKKKSIMMMEMMLIDVIFLPSWNSNLYKR